MVLLLMLCANILRLTVCFIFFFNDTATTDIYTLSLHDALPICQSDRVPAVEQFLGNQFTDACILTEHRVAQTFCEEIGRAHV